MLGVARALGDRAFKIYGVVGLADVQEIEKPDWCLVACDGLYDVYTNDQIREAIKVIRKGGKAEEIKDPDTSVIVEYYNGKGKMHVNTAKTPEEKVA